jgi:tRNA threonylcarbamoyladenosine biosynthesis protein TsaE
MKLKSNYTTLSPEETKKIARDFAKLCKPGAIVCLHGDLGAGKTTFVKGMAAGLKLKDTVKSPSFTIINEYGTGKKKLYHMDLYRLQNADLHGLGLEDYLGNEGICVIEWAERLSHVPGNVWNVNIKRVSDKKRRISITEGNNEDTRN